jgi:hypothetical protein
MAGLDPGLDPAIPLIKARPRLTIGIAGSSPAMTAEWARSDREIQSTEMFANFTTFAHFSVSSATSLPNSAGLIGIGIPPSS